MKYQERHYQEAAQELCKMRGAPAYHAEATVRAWAENAMAFYIADNPDFDRARFLKACELEAN